MTLDESDVREELFWDLAHEMCTDPNVAEGTMMGFPCLRVNGQFFASLDKNSKHMIVKLPAARVAELVGSGQGQPFAPNGRVFREWTALGVPDEDTWRAILHEARTFVDV